jgi:hypothetical protein
LLLLAFNGGICQGLSQTAKPIETEALSELSGKTINFTELIHAMRDARVTRYFIKGCRVRFDPKVDVKGMDAWWKDSSYKHTIYSQIIFIDIDFDPTYWFVLKNAHFKHKLTFLACKNIKLLLHDSVIDSTLNTEDSEIGFIKLKNCKIGGFEMLAIRSVSDEITIQQTQIYLNDKGWRHFLNDAEYTHLFKIESKNSSTELILEDVTIAANDKIKYLTPPKARMVELDETNFSNLILRNCRFKVPLLLMKSTVSNSLILESVALEKGIVLNGLSINPLNTSIDWSSIGNGKMAVALSDSTFANAAYFQTYDDPRVYPKLVSSYTNIFQTYRAQGNRFDADAAYIEFKRLQTKRYYAHYLATGNTESYFLYSLDRFIDVFSDYGTSTYKSFRFSLYVILAFACIYFVAPFTPGPNQRRTLGTQFILYGTFLNTRRQPYRLFLEHLALFDDQARAGGIRRQLRRSALRLPSFYKRLHSVPDLTLYNMFLRIEGYLYKRLGSRKNRIIAWAELPRRRRWQIKGLLGLALLSSIVYFTLRKMLDAVVLSLNVFSTLGFGEIRVGGLVSYITIIQGFIGWFLLSIFSVVLLNQLIQ